jgi:hypothetical protein
MAPTSIHQTIEGSPVAGSKRPAASLLPAFEPFSSSPTLPRPPKRNRDALNEDVTYPTPVPTSSTAILSSSPPRVATGRPPLQRLHSTVSERAPLSDVPTIELNPNGKPVRMGRSSASCHYQLSSNRLISRVHVEATYRPASTSLERDRVEIVCTGWNGIKVHCLGKVYDLVKGKKFSSDVQDVDIMVDVQDARVLLKWPPMPRLGPISSDEESSPTKRSRTLRRHSTPPSPSPLRARQRMVSPVSPSPAVKAALMPSSPPKLPNSPSAEAVIVYEDAPSPEKSQEDPVTVSQSTQALSQQEQALLATSQDSLLSSSQDFSDHDEENDPIIHSFGPFGQNLNHRMASFTAGDSPRLGTPPRSFRPEPLRPAVSPSQPTSFSDNFDITGHVINQLAFSRLSSTPLSTILSHLPDEARAISKDELTALINTIDCVGHVSREGKDAAGKKLESEYYYIPDGDKDEKRKEAVVNDLMKPGLRACRKQHKVCNSCPSRLQRQC